MVARQNAKGLVRPLPRRPPRRSRRQERRCAKRRSRDERRREQEGDSADEREWSDRPQHRKTKPRGRASIDHQQPPHDASDIRGKSHLPYADSDDPHSRILLLCGRSFSQHPSIFGFDW
jgi:hypothetical protein